MSGAGGFYDHHDTDPFEPVDDESEDDVTDLSICPKCGGPRDQVIHRGRGNGWKCDACRLKSKKIRMENQRQKRAAMTAAKPKEEREGKGVARSGCICVTGAADICPVCRPGAVEARILAADDFWRMLGI